MRSRTVTTTSQRRIAWLATPWSSRSRFAVAGTLIGFCGTLLLSNPVPNPAPRQDRLSHDLQVAPAARMHHRLTAVAGTEQPATSATIDPSTRLAELTAVTTAADPANLSDLIAVLTSSPEAALRAEAAQGLAEIGGESAALALESALDDPSAMVRRMAIEALATRSDAHAWRVLRRAEQHPDGIVRRQSIDALDLAEGS